MRELGGRVIDRRTALGRALANWRAQVIEDLGGPEAVSTQEATIVDLAVRTKLLLDSLDSWLLAQRSLVNGRKRSVIPAVIQRQLLADALARYLIALGLRRRARPSATLSDYVAAQYEGNPPTTVGVDSRANSDEPA